MSEPSKAFVSPDDSQWHDASKFSVIHRDKIDAIYSAVLGSSMQNPWDQESGCERPKPASPEKAIEEFDALYETHIKRVNSALDLIRALYSAPRLLPAISSPTVASEPNQQENAG